MGYEWDIDGIYHLVVKHGLLENHLAIRRGFSQRTKPPLSYDSYV